ncbi:uncharacterized protein [Primulina huaijiensis]|uniref:uncharacterized protein isoform X2 n=1 Tax=Primulina huaijiensis TaxID=1492673 RepID=UPI003CC78265
MSRPMLLVFLLLVLIITSQFEWRQQLMSDVDMNSRDSHKQEQISKREESIKEKPAKRVWCSRNYQILLNPRIVGATRNASSSGLTELLIFYP